MSAAVTGIPSQAACLPACRLCAACCWAVHRGNILSPAPPRCHCQVHLDDGREQNGWRNTLPFDPLWPYRRGARGGGSRLGQERCVQEGHCHGRGAERQAPPCARRPRFHSAPHLPPVRPTLARLLLPVPPFFRRGFSYFDAVLAPIVDALNLVLTNTSEAWLSLQVRGWRAGRTPCLPPLPVAELAVLAACSMGACACPGHVAR